eukprot:1616136-Rhodomonas_salina.2
MMCSTRRADPDRSTSCLFAPATAKGAEHVRVHSSSRLLCALLSKARYRRRCWPVCHLPGWYAPPLTPLLFCDPSWLPAGVSFFLLPPFAPRLVQAARSAVALSDLSAKGSAATSLVQFVPVGQATMLYDAALEPLYTEGEPIEPYAWADAHGP